MPRFGRTVWLASALCLGASMARAQDDLAPPPKPGLKKSTVPLPPDDLRIPPAPTKPKPASSNDIPGVELPLDEPPAPLKKRPTEQKTPERIEMPTVEQNASPPKAPVLEAEERKTENQPPTRIELSPPVAAQSQRPRKPVEPLPADPPVEVKQESKAIPAPANAGKPRFEELLAQSRPPQERLARRKTIEVEKKKAADEAETKSAVIQAGATEPLPRAENKYELVAPRLPNYDVVQSKSAPNHRADAISTVYETQGEGGEGIIQVGASKGEGAASIESYAVRIWTIDGWESFGELARMEYRDESLATALAKYNRSGRRPTDALPAGQKVRLPPKSVLERGSGRVVAKRPAPVRTDFAAPPATSVQPMPAGSGMVAASDRSKGALAKNKGASPLPTVADEGRVFVVEEKGMTLYTVAKRTLGDGLKWKQIFDINADRVSSSQGELKIGTRLRLPEGTSIR
jgi:hypothetical protein